MDSAGGSVNVARNKEFQALYKLRGKPLNTYSKQVTEVRKNNEIDDIFSILKCGSGKSFDIEKLKFGKIITLSDADDDGKHIELLLTTIFTSQLLEVARAGRFYITVTPLYRVIKNNVDNIFLDTKKDLVKFFAKEFNENFVFSNDDGVKLTDKQKNKYIEKLLAYSDTLKNVANKYNISPNMFELGFLNFYDADEGEFTHPENIRMDELPNGNITVSGFLDTGNEEMFIFINADPEELEADLSNLQNMYFEAVEYANISTKSGKAIEANSLYDLITKINDTVNKYCNVTRFKGLI